MPGSEVDTREAWGRVAMVARALTGRLDVSEIVEIMVHQGMAGLEANGAVFVALDGRHLVPLGAVGYPPSVMDAMGPLDIDRPLPITTAAREQVAVYVPSHAEVVRRFPEMASSRSRSMAWAAIPVIVDGSVLGVFGVSFLREHVFSAADRLFLETLVDVAANAIACRLENAFEQRPPVVDLRAMVVRVVASYPAATHRVRASCADGALLAAVDATRVREVLDHLVLNAVRHTMTGTTVHVHCHVRGAGSDGDGASIEIIVDDEGAGLSPARRRSIFEAAADGQRRGLATAHHLAQADGGSLECTVAPTGGARFVLSYPAAH